MVSLYLEIRGALITPDGPALDEGCPADATVTTQLTCQAGRPRSVGSQIRACSPTGRLLRSAPPSAHRHRPRHPPAARSTISLSFDAISVGEAMRPTFTQRRFRDSETWRHSRVLGAQLSVRRRTEEICPGSPTWIDRFYTTPTAWQTSHP